MLGKLYPEYWSTTTHYYILILARQVVISLEHYHNFSDRSAQLKPLLLHASDANGQAMPF